MRKLLDCTGSGLHPHQRLAELPRQESGAVSFHEHRMIWTSPCPCSSTSCVCLGQQDSREGTQALVSLRHASCWVVVAACSAARGEGQTTGRCWRAVCPTSFSSSWVVGA